MYKRQVEELAETGLGFIGGKGLHGFLAAVVDISNLVKSFDLVKLAEFRIDIFTTGR